MTLNKTINQKQASKAITIGLPKSNPNIKTDIDAELNNGWRIATSFYDSTRDELRVIFTRPKRQA
jgi:hypothetical protein